MARALITQDHHDLCCWYTSEYLPLRRVVGMCERQHKAAEVACNRPPSAPPSVFPELSRNEVDKSSISSRVVDVSSISSRTPPTPPPTGRVPATSSKSQRRQSHRFLRKGRPTFWSKQFPPTEVPCAFLLWCIINLSVRSYVEIAHVSLTTSW